MSVARVVGELKAKLAILEGTRWHTAKELAQLGAGVDVERREKRIHTWLSQGRLFSLRLEDGLDRFPLYAFDQNGQPHAVLKEILTCLGPINSWRIAAWFNSNTRFLGGRAPRELIGSDPEAVLQAASHYHNYPG